MKSWTWNDLNAAGICYYVTIVNHYNQVKSIFNETGPRTLLDIINDKRIPAYIRLWICCRQNEYLDEWILKVMIRRIKKLQIWHNTRVWANEWLYVGDRSISSARKLLDTGGLELVHRDIVYNALDYARMQIPGENKENYTILLFCNCDEKEQRRSLKDLRSILVKKT